MVSRWYRNRRVGEFLKELELTEGRGTGIPRMLKALKRNNSPLPIFHTDKNRAFLTVEFPIHPLFLEEDVEGGKGKRLVESSEKSSEKSSDKILAEIRKNDKVSAKELAEILQLSSRAIEKQIASLKSTGILKRVGGRKLGHWEIVAGE
jgi:ATP-dependent DNA helicase RecG